MIGTKQRVVESTDSDYPEKTEVAAYLKMTPKTLLRLIEKGLFPRPFQFSPGVWVWCWREVSAWAVMREVRGRCYPSKKADGQSAPNPTPTATQSGTSARRAAPAN
jgi:predicted DNA-binding transcriptional regulator AlpA